MPKERTNRQELRAAQREAAERTKRRGVLLKRGALALVVVAAGALAVDYYRRSHLLDTATTATYSAGVHMVGRINFAENPPLGGPHHAAWQNCGVYDAPIHSEHAVHSMEHGAVWITYRPDLPPDQVQILREAAADDFMLLSPFPDLAVPVVASAWNHQIRLDGAADPRLRAFIDRYKNNPETTPEFGAPCAGAIGTTAAVDSLENSGSGTAR